MVMQDLIPDFQFSPDVGESFQVIPDSIHVVSICIESKCYALRSVAYHSEKCSITTTGTGRVDSLLAILTPVGTHTVVTLTQNR